MSVLVATQKADDVNLLTLAEARDVVGVKGHESDAKVDRLRRAVAASISSACKVRRAGVAPRTLRQETLAETWYPREPFRNLILARRPIISIDSITENDIAVDPCCYEIEPNTGIVRRLWNNQIVSWGWCWSWGIFRPKIVANYVAGWDTVPDDLKLAAGRYLQMLWLQDGRDPAQRIQQVEGLSRNEWFPSDGSAIPESIFELLQDGGYVNLVVG